MTVRSRILTFGLKGDLLNKMLRKKKGFLIVCDAVSPLVLAS